MATLLRSRLPLWVAFAVFMALADALLVSWRLRNGWLAAGCGAATAILVLLWVQSLHRPTR
ncbi:MAG: hypothetical protein ACRD2I_19255 [Vicinamibacterales bacterium]